MRMMKGAATNTDGNDGDNEVKLRTVKTRRGADAGSRTGKAASRMQRCSATTGWKVSSVCLLRSHTHTYTRARSHAQHTTRRHQHKTLLCSKPDNKLWITQSKVKLTHNWGSNRLCSLFIMQYLLKQQLIIVSTRSHEMDC